MLRQIIPMRQSPGRRSELELLDQLIHLVSILTSYKNGNVEMEKMIQYDDETVSPDQNWNYRIYLYFW